MNITLGHLAMKFRGTRSIIERLAISDDYAKEVNRLIEGGSWTEIPGPEDELPEFWMPTEYYDHWGLQQP